ncbi:zinc ABC transporter substrate-binding protein [Pseudovibrio exalbescens]|uniref:High-affinity zinc uptake system protein ZnuA n=1 Tax=Pseudovibrio exalbescens TaxID=197461 RepID=A0A1U7JIH1_9HYPH|nr:zinc ABC transporter substrate-binding protein [Pseudovibrio exalbescens]OKL44517.1 zinc ABC transporter substrate-binding protein [Pseudovibrio exalbescens]
MSRILTPVLASVSFLGLVAGAAAAPQVVTTIKPIHSLTAGVMKGVGAPTLLIEGAGSPHAYSLKPSQAAALQDADLIVWMGPQLETFLTKPLETLSGGAHTLTLAQSDGVKTLAFREGGSFERHSHDHDEEAHDHDHGDHEDHDHEGEHGHEAHDHSDHDEHADEHAHHDHDHDHDGVDPHMWLDPANAKAFVSALAEELSEIDPDNAATYEANAQALQGRLDGLMTQVSGELAPVQGKPFIVFHDAYQYFENRFDISAAGSITVSPERAPGAERVAEIQHRIEELDVSCVFSEPQFEPKIVRVLVDGTQAKAGELDPLGATLDAGENQYFELINGLAAGLTECLAD